MGNYELVKTFSIACAHQIPEMSKCAQIHGHNYQVTFCLTGEQLDSHHMLIDFRLIKHAIEDRYDHRLLNELAEFDPNQGGVLPTTERIAEVFFRRIRELCQMKDNKPQVNWVKVAETADAYAIYREELPANDETIN